MSIQQKIDRHLNDIFQFKLVKGWYREGRCPQCNKKSCYTHAEKPRIIKCNHQNNCGYEEHVKEICADLFKDWTAEFPKTKENPTASADAYLVEARGLDITKLKGMYTQEIFNNDKKYPGQYSATVRFKLAGADNVYWERLIDRTERFGSQKANIINKFTGLYWTYHQKFDDLCISKEVWLPEGIFNSIALSFNNIVSAATISSNNYPTKLLEQIKQRCEVLQVPLPTLVWAFDNDDAGRKATRKFHDRAVEDGWDSTAAFPILAKDSDLDWNDLHERGLLTEADDLKRYRHFGQLHIAKSEYEAAHLIYNYHNQKKNTFSFTHQYQTYWFSLDNDKYQKEYDVQLQIKDSAKEAEEEALKQAGKVELVCKAIIKGLYFQRNTITDESWYYFKIIDGISDPVNATFTTEQFTSKQNFTNRLLNISKGAWWLGNDKQLQTIMLRETDKRYIKEVKTIDFIGYSKEYRAYIFNKHAVYKGKVIHINDQDFYRTGKVDVKTLSNSPVVQLNPEPFQPTWWQDFYQINREKGLILLAWWTGSFFAEQIREKHYSYPFMEYVGQAGAGKSSLIDFFWKLSARVGAKEGINPNSSSPAAIHRSMAQVSNLPVVFIEGDRKTDQKQAKQKFDWDELKDAFNGQNIRSRGLKTSGNDTYEPPFRGAILISQNDPINATEAILSRTLHIYVDMQGHTYEKKLIANRLYGIEFSEAAKYMTHCLKQEDNILKTFFEKFGEIEKEFHQSGISHTRIALCHAQISAMIDALAAHVLKDTIDLEEICDAKRMLEEMARSRMNDLSDDHVQVKQFWEVYEYLNGIKRNANFSLNHHNHNDPNIAINLNEIYKAASMNYQALPDINDMRTLLKSSKKYKFIEMNKQVRSTSFPVDEGKNVSADIATPRNVKCWIFSNPNQFKPQ
ncbi:MULTISPECIES: toprim domain-containing protein [unclassified Acinetobacter]|uniref:toprim domain-containing protein n=1 Tax=unclassified Acinetobacter TaxID=196816 RepID=UPI0022AC0B96|nr:MULTISPECIES: toprim domain-containing protein [unclassified Acinetobacter]WAU72978.1 toprim domain-containing protein [Acinetobacter sp. TR11]WAU76071.1 toprim domain-containing protein [Acinetobacter sp. TR3]